ncbi:unnamed protein product, partial [Urochloa humidicola]
PLPIDPASFHADALLSLSPPTPPTPSSRSAPCRRRRRSPLPTPLAQPPAATAAAAPAPLWPGRYSQAAVQHRANGGDLLRLRHPPFVLKTSSRPNSIYIP